MTADDLFRHSFAYLRRGWAVIPVAPHEKRPLVRWEAFQDRLPTEGEVRIWNRRWPTANIGIVTGAVSGLLVLDIDPQHGGTESLVRMEREDEALPKSVEAATGGGGRHIYFRHPGGHVANRVGIGPGIDLRGDGGLIVAPPSIHPSGRPYAWRPSHDPRSRPLAMAPVWLLHAVADTPPQRGHPMRYWRAVLATGVSEGERNNTIASLAGHLLWHGVDPGAVTELLLCWNEVRCRPPLSPEEVARTVESIRRTQQRHLAN
ncbi:MAG: DNA primase [bacterium]|nr:DNA primase [bacterium]